MLRGLVFVLLVISSCIVPATEQAPLPDTVVLLHGLARTASSMHKMQRVLEKNGYHVCNIDYPSRKHPIEVLVHDFVLPAITACANQQQTLHFVTHSMGGIVVRKLAQEETRISIGRVVMLSPPNQGSQVVDKLGGLGLFHMLNGPAGNQLGTDHESVPNTLGAATFELGIITGDQSINLILSMLIPGKDDGKVSVENAKLEGMRDFVVVPASHPFIMKNKIAIEQTLAFLREGKFSYQKQSTSQTCPIISCE